MTEPFGSRRNWGARVRRYDINGLRAVFLENERLRLGFLVDRGTDLIEFNYKPLDLDMVWLAPNAPSALRPSLQSAMEPTGMFLDHYLGGWQEVFPNGGAPSTYAGASYGQHGEVCLLPWECSILEDSADAVMVRFEVRGRKSPFSIEKVVRLERDTTRIAFEETVVNRSEVDLHAMWGHHIALGFPFLAPGSKVDLPEGATVIPHERAICEAGRRISGGETYRWPLAKTPLGGKLDLSVIPERGEASEIVYLTDLEEGWYRVTNPRGVSFRVDWDLTTMPYLWYWQEFGGTRTYPWYGRTFNIGLEPFSSYPTNGLAEAVRNRSALLIKGGETRSFSMSACVSASELAS